jgi:cyanophycinase
MNKFLTCVVAGFLTVTPAASGSLAPDRPAVVVPRPSSARQAPAGSLLLVGGGDLPDAVRQRFLELAGGRAARLVLIPSASALPEAADSARTLWQDADVKSVRVLHATSRHEADDPRLFGVVRDATGVWISGGDQSRLAALYDGTAVERGLRDVLAHGGVVAGTSAGASIVTDVMMAEGGRAGQGFGLLTGTVVDQHFSNRGRLPRLLALLRSHPCEAGIGIDQETAVLIRGGEVSVLGNATVTVAGPTVRVYRAGSHFPYPAPRSVACRQPGQQPVAEGGEHGAIRTPRWPTASLPSP